MDQRPMCHVCGKGFSNRHNLGQHFKFRHPGKNLLTAMKGPEATKSLPAPAVIGAQEHLRTALQALTARQSSVAEELSRMNGLQAEKDAVANQIKAVEAALRAFEG
jgi:hypothetical protein